jgi:hypothetical protein
LELKELEEYDEKEKEIASKACERIQSKMSLEQKLMEFYPELKDKLKTPYAYLKDKTIPLKVLFPFYEQIIVPVARAIQLSLKRNL